MKNITVGFVGFGEVNTPREIIERKCSEAFAKFGTLGATLVQTAPVNDDAAGANVQRAITELSGHRLDALVVCIAGWIPTHAVIRVTSEFRHLPMLLWGLAGYYDNGRLVTTADQAGTTALRKTMQDLGYRFSFAYESPGVPTKVEPLRNFLLAVRATRVLRDARVGSMGYRDMNLYATLFDGISLKRTLGVEIEFFEMLELVQRAENVDPADIRTLADKIRTTWTFESPAQPGIVETSARYFLGLKAIVADRRFDALTLIDVDGMKKLLQVPPAVIFMLVGDELGLPTIPENDCLGAVTQLLVRALTDQAAPYFEFYEFLEDRLLVGVPDYVPTAVVTGGVKVRPTRFGALSGGLLNVSKVIPGQVTLTRLLPHAGGYAVHAVTGTAVAPRAWEEAGWAPPAPQLPGLEIILDLPIEKFAEQVAGQHYILSYGDTTKALASFCRLNGLTLL